MRRLRKPSSGVIGAIRQLVLSTSGAIVGLVTAVPPMGVAVGALASLVGLKWKSPKEKEQARRIAELERRVAFDNSPAGIRRRRGLEARLDKLGRWHE